MTTDETARNKRAPDLEAVPLPESHRAELERRLADLDKNPDAGSTWEEVRARLEWDLVPPSASPAGATGTPPVGP